MIDAGGKYLTPGIIDSHSHIALDDDVNEATSPVTPQMMMMDAFDYQDKAIYRGLAGGVTTSLLLHGSANMIGGQAVVIKHKYGANRDAMLFPGAPRSIKFASGENPKRVYGSKDQLPSTRMGNFAVQRAALVRSAGLHARVGRLQRQGQARRQGCQAAQARSEAGSPGRCSARQAAGADPLLSRRRIAHRDGDGEGIRLQGARVPSRARGLQSRRTNWPRRASAIATFSDWWGYKQEAWDAIPWNAVISMRKGVRVAIKSDSEDFARRLNQEAAKTMRYGGATEEEALKMITINPAWIVGVDDRVGSIEVGKDADLVLWDGYPLSSFGVPEQSADRRRCLLRPLAAGIRHAALSGGRVMRSSRRSSVVSRQKLSLAVGRWSLANCFWLFAICLPARSLLAAQQKACRP